MVPDTERKWIAREMAERPLAPRKVLLAVTVLLVLLMILWKAC
jgi:hypothetical protein